MELNVLTGLICKYFPPGGIFGEKLYSPVVSIPYDSNGFWAWGMSKSPSLEITRLLHLLGILTLNSYPDAPETFLRP